MVDDVEFKADTIAGLFVTGLYLYTCSGREGPESATKNLENSMETQR